MARLLEAHRPRGRSVSSAVVVGASAIVGAVIGFFTQNFDVGIAASVLALALLAALLQARSDIRDAIQPKCG